MSKKFNAKKKYENDVKSSEGGGGGDIRRVKLAPGVTVLRIVEDNYEKVWVHHFKGVDDEGKEKNRRTVCLGKGKCPVCDEGHKAKPRYYFNVVDMKERKKNEGKFQVRLLECGKMVFDGISALALDEEYGDPTQYNVKIERKGEGKMDTKYSVRAGRKIFSLKERDEKIINKTAEEGGAYDLSYFTAKQTKAELLAMLGKPVDSEEEEEEETEEEEDTDEDDDGEEEEEEIDLEKELGDLDDEDDEEEETKKPKKKCKKKKKKVKDEEEDDIDEDF